MCQTTLDETSCTRNRINPRGKRFLFRPVTKGEVLKVISSLKRSKSPGLDNIPPRTVKDAALAITQPLLHILNLSLSTSKVPSEWKVARCVPIFKGGDAKILDNYRPISVLPVFSKILERVVHFQLYEYLENNELLSPFQFGFRKNRSTASAVVHLTDTVRKNMDMGQLTGALFIDLRKAFDTVDHQSLTSKLLCYGVENNELKWIEDYLSNRSQIVSFEGEKSREEKILFGVPQGSILGPLLFLIHVNDLHHQIQKSNLIMYADDTVLLFSDKSEAEIEKAINHDAKMLHNWLCSNGLILNPKQGKTEFMMFGTAGKRSKITHQTKITIDSKDISNTNSYKYLGIHLDMSLTLNDHVQKISKKALSRLGLLLRIRPILTTHAAVDLYKAMVQPVMTYCSIAFATLSETNETRFRKIEKRALKIIFGAQHKMHRVWRSFASMRSIQCADFVFKCLNGTAPEVFHNYFMKLEHGKATRRDGTDLRMPKVRTESGKRGIYYSGTKIFNDLPLHLKTEKYYINFKKALKEHFID